MHSTSRQTAMKLLVCFKQFADYSNFRWSKDASNRHGLCTRRCK